jgi:hypothetical protein
MATDRVGRFTQVKLWVAERAVELGATVSVELLYSRPTWPRRRRRPVAASPGKPRKSYRAPEGSLHSTFA